MPAMIFQARCPRCGADGKFIEFKVEPCTDGPGAPEREYGFRCMACRSVSAEVADATGRVHRFVEGRHVDA